MTATPTDDRLRGFLWDSETRDAEVEGYYGLNHQHRLRVSMSWSDGL